MGARVKTICSCSRTEGESERENWSFFSFSSCLDVIEDDEGMMCQRSIGEGKRVWRSRRSVDHFFFPSKLTVSILCFSVDASVVILTMTGWYHSTMLLAQHPLCTIVCASLSPASSSSSSFSSSCLRPFHKLISNNYRHVNAHWDHNNSFRWLPDSDSDSE